MPSGKTMSPGRIYRDGLGAAAATSANDARAARAINKAAIVMGVRRFNAVMFMPPVCYANAMGGFAERRGRGTIRPFIKASRMCAMGLYFSIGMCYDSTFHVQ